MIEQIRCFCLFQCCYSADCFNSFMCICFFIWLSIYAVTCFLIAWKSLLLIILGPKVALFLYSRVLVLCPTCSLSVPMTLYSIYWSVIYDSSIIIQFNLFRLPWALFITSFERNYAHITFLYLFRNLILNYKL